MIPAVSCTNLYDIYDQVKDFAVIGIDEGQFFDDIVEFSEEMANAGKIVVIAALDGTFDWKKFGKVIDLIPLAERVEKLDAVCMDCKETAYFTKRIIDSKETEVIGGAEFYKPVCWKCHVKDTKMRQPLTEIIKEGKEEMHDCESPINFEDENSSGANYDQSLKFKGKSA